MRALTLTILILTTTLLLNACASKQAPNYSEISANEIENLSDKVSPQEFVERVAALYDQAQNLDLQFYSPTNYQASLTALATAKKQLNVDSKNNGEAAIRPAIAAQKLLEKAQTIRASVDRNLKDVIKHRNLLIEIGAPTWQKTGYEQVSEEIKELILLIEKNEVKSALKKEPAVRSEMYELEIDTLLISTLDNARRTLAEAKKAEAELYAPQLYNKADILIDDTEIYIKGNYRDRKGIQERADNAHLVAQTALKYTLDGQQIFALDEAQVEDYLAAYHAQLDTLSKLVTQATLIPMTVSESLSSLITALESQVSQAKQTPVMKPELEPEVNTEDKDLEVLQVLDSLDLKSQAIPLFDDQNGNEQYDDEQSFDSIEYVE